MVLVLGSLRPRGHQVRELEVARLRTAPGDSTFVVPELDEPGDVTFHVAADVVQVEVEGRRVALRRPVLGRRVEHELHVGRQVAMLVKESRSAWSISRIIAGASR